MLQTFKFFLVNNKDSLTLSKTLLMLGWRSPRTLANTIENYNRRKFLAHFDKKILVYNESHFKLPKRVVNSFDMILSLKENMGIAPALSLATNLVTTKYLLFLEDDWILAENEELTHKRLLAGEEILKHDIADVVRYRHRYEPGEPLLSKKFLEGLELTKGLNHLLDSIHWRDDTAELFKGKIDNKIVMDEQWYISPSKFANYTNNPCFYRTAFFTEVMWRYRDSDGIRLELDIHDWWAQNDFKVAQGNGLFSHFPLEKNGHDVRLIKIYKLLVKVISVFKGN